MPEKSRDKSAPRAPANADRRAAHRERIAATTTEPKHAGEGRRKGAAARTGKTIRRVGA